MTQLQTNSNNLPAIVDNRWLASVAAIHDRFRSMPELAHRNADGTTHTPQLADSIMVLPHYISVNIIDPRTLHHLKLAQLRTADVEQKLTNAVGLPVAIVPPAILQTVLVNEDGSPLSRRQAEAMVAYAVQLLPSVKVAIPTQINLPAERDDRIYLGMGENEKNVAFSRKNLKNIQLTGNMGWGKSEMIRALMVQFSDLGWIIMACEPTDSNTFHPIEMWARFKGMASVCEDCVGLESQLDAINAEIADRASRFAEYAERYGGGVPPTDVEDYTAKTGQKMPSIALIIDELPVLLSEDLRGNVLDKLVKLMRVGRKWGVMIVAGSQDWRGNAVDRDFSVLIETRICFRVADAEVAKSTLNVRGGTWVNVACNFRQPGRAAVRSSEGLLEMQAFYVSPERVAEYLSQVKAAPIMDEPLRDAPIKIEADEIDWDLAVRMAVWSHENDEDRFRSRGVFAMFVTEFQQKKIDVIKFGQYLVEHGYLTKGKSTTPRRITDKLMRKAGIY